MSQTALYRKSQILNNTMNIFNLFCKKKPMKLITIILIYLMLPAINSQNDKITVLFWNLENFFDYKDKGKGVADKEFSSSGKRRWTANRFNAKCRAFCKSIFWIAEKNKHFPDIIGVAEIENRFVLERCLKSTNLRKMDYGIVHYDSFDHRGIDVALFYRKSKFRLLSSKPCRIYKDIFLPNDTILPTRDILLVKLKANIPPNYPTLCVLVNHHPSKYGGNSSENRRLLAINRLREIMDSLYLEHENILIATGDFNEEAKNSLFERISTDSKKTVGYINMGAKLKGEGSIRFNGKWELIDNFFISKTITGAKMQLIKIPFLMTWDKVHTGEKPLRTFVGPKYNGGVSDHLPILLEMPTSTL